MHYRLPGEWEAQAAVLVAWPHETMDWRPYLDEMVTFMTSLTAAIATYEPVIIVAIDATDARATLAARLTPGQMDNVVITELPLNDTWIRDYGPITLVGQDRQLHLHFRFNAWGEKFHYHLDNAVTRLLAQRQLLPGDYLSQQDLVLEGGSIESDGCGTILTTRDCLLSPQRNGHLTDSEIEDELRRRLHATEVLLLPTPTLIGDDTDGHIDTIVRFAPNGTILHAVPLPASLAARYHLVPLPMPDPIIYDGEQLPATYANFLVINHAVIVPIFGDRHDQRAIDTIQQAFPGRVIIPLNSLVPIRQHGSIHCLTMQIPL